jgi:hypothetical protein
VREPCVPSGGQLWNAASLRAMNERRREQPGLLARTRFGAAVVLVVLAIVGAIRVATSESDVLFFEDVQRDNRGATAIAALGSETFAAGVVAALRGILMVLLEKGER